MLDALVRLLMDGGVIRRSPPVDEDQKLDELGMLVHCTLIAGRLGLDHGYVFDDKLSNGPYSKRLYNDLEEAVPRARAGLGCDAPPLPDGLDGERLLRLLAGKDADWIKAATYLIVFSHARPDVEGLVELVGEMASGRSAEQCRGIVEEMTSPEIGIVLDCDKYTLEGCQWQPVLASSVRYPAVAPPIPAASG